MEAWQERREWKAYGLAWTRVPGEHKHSRPEYTLIKFVAHAKVFDITWHKNGWRVLINYLVAMDGFATARDAMKWTRDWIIQHSLED